MPNPKINVILDEDEIEKLKQYAKSQSRSVSNLAAFIIRTWLSDQENKPLD